jgi:CMP-N-acetylneuraminic acid synthetase
MAYRGQTLLALVPARGGSKGIPKKNLRHIGGVSLVGRAGDLLRDMDFVDARVLSTDDSEIAREGKAHGLDVPFMRPADIASDTANSIDVWRHAWLASEAHYGKRFDVSILLEPTSPLRRAQDVTAALDRLLDGNHRTAVTVSRAPAHFTPHKCLTVADGRIGFYYSEGAKHSIRQTIPAYYFRNGICYAVRRQAIVEEGAIFGDACAAVVIDRPIVNIDEPLDLELAEFLLERGH